MGNETKNAVALAGGQALQVRLMSEFDQTAKETGREFTEYGKQCMMNAISQIVIYCKTYKEKIDINDFDGSMLRLAIQNIGYTELNCAALPSECYPDVRKDKNSGKYFLTFKPQGAGNEKLLRKYGVNVKELKSPLIIREGDDYTLPGFDGEKMTPFKWQPKSLNKKVIMVVYPLVKTDGTYEYLMATREGILPNLVAQLRQTYLFDSDKDKLYKEFNADAEKMTTDEFIDKYFDKLNPTYTSAGSKEAMILRKMKNNALKNYPKEYGDTYIKDAVESMFEDRDDSLKEKPNIVDADVVEKVEEDIAEKPKGDEVPDFDVGEVDEVAKEKSADPKAEPKTNDYGF